MCSVNEAVVHPECFQCSTCGTLLKNVGHHYIDEKFYCDIHGAQRKQQTQIPTQQNNGRAAPPILNTMNRRPLNPDLVVYVLLNPHYYNSVFAGGLLRQPFSQPGSRNLPRASTSQKSSPPVPSLHRNLLSKPLNLFFSDILFHLELSLYLVLIVYFPDN